MWGNLILTKSQFRRVTSKWGSRMIPITQKLSLILEPRCHTRTSWSAKPYPTEEASRTQSSNKNPRRITSRSSKLMHPTKRTISASITCWSNKTSTTSNTQNSAPTHASHWRSRVASPSPPWTKPLSTIRPTWKPNSRRKSNIMRRWPKQEHKLRKHWKNSKTSRSTTKTPTHLNKRKPLKMR